MAAKKQQQIPLDASDVEDDDAGFEVTEVIDPDEVGDLTDVKRDDTIPATNDVRFIVHAAKVDVRVDKEDDGGDGSVLSKALRIQAKITEQGINDKGDFANKVLFCDLPLVLNLPAMAARHERIQERLVSEGKVKQPKAFNEKWHKDSLVDFKEFALATGLAEMHEVTAEDKKLIKKGRAVGSIVWYMPQPINDELLAILASGDVEFIANVSRRENTQMDRFENKLSRFRAPAAE